MGLFMKIRSGESGRSGDDALSRLSVSPLDFVYVWVEVFGLSLS